MNRPYEPTAALTVHGILRPAPDVGCKRRVDGLRVECDGQLEGRGGADRPEADASWQHAANAWLPPPKPLGGRLPSSGRARDVDSHKRLSWHGKCSDKFCEGEVNNKQSEVTGEDVREGRCSEAI